MATQYDIHPSTDLRQLFAEMAVPYQGQEPEKANVIFVGLDANYAEELFDYPNFRDRILEYHRDGVAFWKRHGVHHPFLLDEYPTDVGIDGVRYHKQFRKMNLSSEYADQISFVELLRVPTTGNTQKTRFWELFDQEHAKRLDIILSSGRSRLVLLSNGVIQTMRKANKNFGLFLWLPKSISPGCFKRIGNTEIHKVMHFSASISDDQIADMGELIRNYSKK